MDSGVGRRQAGPKAQPAGQNQQVFHGNGDVRDALRRQPPEGAGRHTYGYNGGRGMRTQKPPTAYGWGFWNAFRDMWVMR